MLVCSRKVHVRAQKHFWLRSIFGSEGEADGEHLGKKDDGGIHVPGINELPKEFLVS